MMVEDTGEVSVFGRMDKSVDCVNVEWNKIC